jgi:hypothetical protein
MRGYYVPTGAARVGDTPDSLEEEARLQEKAAPEEYEPTMGQAYVVEKVGPPVPETFTEVTQEELDRLFGATDDHPLE